MTTVICILLILAALGGIFVLQCEILPCLIVAAAAVVILFLQKAVFRKKQLIPLLLCTVVLAGSLRISIRPTAYGYLNYLESVDEYAALLSKDKTEKVETLQKEIEEKYGNTKGMTFAQAAEAIENGDYETADELAWDFYGEDRALYCLIREQTIPRLTEDKEEARNELARLYSEASDIDPEWEYAAYMAGAVYMDQKEYDRAAYYLARAYESTSEADPGLCYLFGAALIEQGRTTQGELLMLEALSKGADEETQSYIAWYLQRLEKGGL